MRFSVQRDGDNIFSFKNFDEVKDKGEIAHFICELETIKQELLIMWEEYDEE